MGTSNKSNPLYFPFALDKIVRMDISQDSVEIESLSEPLSVKDTPNTQRESQLARLLYRNGKDHINIKCLIMHRWILDLS